MTARKPPSITPPPSVGDVLSSLAADGPRIGKVKFPTRSPAGAKAADEAPTETVPGATRRSTRARKARPDPDGESRETPEPDPGTGSSPETPTGTVGMDSRAELFGSIGEVTASATARIRKAEAATLKHLVAMEEEALRRCELLTAQAELDAELIRLHARREAHAIITAARMQVEDGPLDDAGAALSEVGRALDHISEATAARLASEQEPPAGRTGRP